MLTGFVVIWLLIIVIVIITALIAKSIEHTLPPTTSRACLSLAFLFLTGISIAYLVSLRNNYYQDGLIITAIVILLFGFIVYQEYGRV